MLVVIPDDFPSIIADDEALKRLRQHAEVVLYNNRAQSEEEFISRIRDAHGVINIRAYSKFTPAVFDACPNLKIISVLGIGTDNVNLDAATRRGVLVCNTPGYSAVSVAEHSLTLMLAAARQIPRLDKELRAGRWTHLPMIQLHGKTLGIVGFGDIGQQLALIGRGIGMEVIAWTFHPSDERARKHNVRFVELDKLLSSSDVVSINIRSSARTQRIIGSRELKLMKRTAILVNTARGAVVDEAALAEVLKAGAIAAAGLDVFTTEPLPADSPFLSLPNVVVTPHTAPVTPETTAAGNRMVVDNIIHFIKGKPINVRKSEG
jgi:phosphoglycerate dehydrogenase-like enzyme